jgi:hypothetical protein
MIKKALLCHHTWPDRLIKVKIGNRTVEIIEGYCAGATFSPIDYHNGNRAYWLRFV